MFRNVKQQGVAVATAVMLVGILSFAIPSNANAEEGKPAAKKKVTAIFESKKGWKFEDDELRFFNPSQNPKGIRFLRWKGYSWVVSEERVICVDPRPYGTRVQGLRHQITEKGRQTDKDLMNDLKGQAGDIRKSADPNHVSIPEMILGIRF